MCRIFHFSVSLISETENFHHHHLLVGKYCILATKTKMKIYLSTLFHCLSLPRGVYTFGPITATAVAVIRQLHSFIIFLHFRSILKMLAFWPQKQSSNCFHISASLPGPESGLQFSLLLTTVYSECLPHFSVAAVHLL